MVDGIEKIDVLIHQLSQLEEDLDKLSDDRRETARAEIQKVRAEIVDLLIEALHGGDVFTRRGQPTALVSCLTRRQWVYWSVPLKTKTIL